MSRRNFMQASVLASVATVLPSVGSAETSASSVPKVTLANGVTMPILGYGTLNLPRETCAKCVAEALQMGWRLIDTAKNYANERLVGEGIRASGIARSELFVTSKLWLKDAGYASTKDAFRRTLERMGLDYLDLYLIHQPFGDVYGSWRAMVELWQEGLIRAIGVSNFLPDRLVDFCLNNEIRPMVNQIEVHPYHQRALDVEFCQKYGVQVEAWSPLCQNRRPELFTEQILVTIGQAHGKTPAQVVLRWLLQRGIVTVVKTQRVERMKENLNVFDFSLNEAEMAQIAALNQDKTIGLNHQSPSGAEWFNTKATRTLVDE